MVNFSCTGGMLAVFRGMLGVLRARCVRCTQGYVRYTQGYVILLIGTYLRVRDKRLRQETEQETETRD